VTPEQIKAAIDSLGRPQACFASIGAVAAGLAAAKAWDRANPELAAEYWHLCAELEAATKREEANAMARAAADRASRFKAIRLERSGIGERSLNAAENAQPTEALEVVQAWLADNAKTWLVLCGARGTGKTVAATWAVREAIRGGGSGAFRRTGELSSLSQFDAGAVEKEHLKRVHLLVVDDFGSELLTDYARAQLHELFDSRHEHYERTIITSNLPWETLAERLGERLVDRIAQAGSVMQLRPTMSLRRTQRATVEAKR